MEEDSIKESIRKIEEEVEYARIPLFGKDTPNPEGQWYLAWLPWRDWDTYAEGYRLAGDAIVDSLSSHTHNQDWLVYPVIFLYRHYIELRLKEIIFVASRLVETPIEIPGHHKLVPLWQQSRQYIKQIWPSADSPEQRSQLDIVEARIIELSKIDPGSFAFRYPVAKNGDPYLQNMDDVNLKHIKQVIKGISHILDGSSTGIGESLRAHQEMQTEMRAEMQEMQTDFQSDMQYGQEF